METPEQIEKALGRLVPPALSEEGTASIEAALDELAAADGGTHETTPPARRWWLGGAAAAALGLAAIPLWWGPVESPAGPVASLEREPMVLLEESGRVISAEEDLTLLAQEDGSVHRAWHVRVVDEERYRDMETGLEVQVVHPRDELVLLPVSHF